MSPDLPDLLAAYSAAENGSDAEGLGACFADHAVVRDEGRTIIFGIEGNKISPLEIR